MPLGSNSVKLSSSLKPFLHKGNMALRWPLNVAPILAWLKASDWSSGLALTENYFRNLVKPTRNQIVFTIFRLTLNQTDVRLVPKQSENGKYNLISVFGHLSEILLNQTEIRLHLPWTNWFRSKRTYVWFKINRKMVNTIWFRVDLIRFRKYFSACTGSMAPPHAPETSRGK